MTEENEPENTPESVPAPEGEPAEDIDHALAAIFSEFEARIGALENELRAEIAGIRERESQHADRYEHIERRNKDSSPGERNWYFRNVGR